MLSKCDQEIFLFARVVTKTCPDYTEMLVSTCVMTRRAIRFPLNPQFRCCGTVHVLGTRHLKNLNRTIKFKIFPIQDDSHFWVDSNRGMTLVKILSVN